LNSRPLVAKKSVSLDVILYNNLKEINLLLICLLIAITVLVGNLYSVFGVKALLLDDLARHYMVGQNQFPAYLSVRSFLLPYTEWFFWKLLYVSPYLARGVHVLFIMIPLSISFYLVFSRHLRLPRSISVGAAVLPNIIPMQSYIPSFVNGCYSVYGLLYAVLTLILCLNFIKLNKLVSLYLVIPVIIFGAAQLMTQAIFLFPSFAILIIFSSGKLSRKLAVLSSFLVTFIFKYYWIKKHPFSDVSKPVKLSIDQIVQRLDTFFSSTTVLSLDTSLFFIFFIFVAVSCFFYIKNPRKLFFGELPFPRYNANVNVILLYAFLAVWIIGSSYVFITQSKHFPVRYLHISSFGVNCLILLLFFSVFSVAKFSRLFKVFLVSLVLFSLIARFHHLKKVFTPSNNHYNFLKYSMASIDYPKDSQIFIAHSDYGTGGYWMWGTGYLQHITNRNDITGHLYEEFSYYDGFEKNRSYSRQTLVRGFDLEKPFFAYRVDTKNKSLVPVHFMLRWLDDTVDSRWVLYELNIDGTLIEFANGDGISEYSGFFNSIGNKGITQNQVLWGGCPKEAAIARLDLDQSQVAALCN